MAFNCMDKEETEGNLLKRLERITREEDWAYLAIHPEIRTIIRSFIRQVFAQRPANIHKFAAEFAKLLRDEHQIN